MEGTGKEKIILIGEYPGEQEVMFNKPFVGGAGKHLWNTLRKFKIRRDMCYSTNVVKRRVTPTRVCEHSEYLLWEEALRFELEPLLETAEVIICLGNAAMKALLGFDGITKYRGSVYDYNGCKVVCANNPALVLRMPQTELIFLMDISKANEVLNGDYKPHHIEKKIDPTFEEVMQYMDDIQTTHKKFAIDIEVIGGETACIGLAHSGHYAMTIPFRDKAQNCWTVEQEYQILQRFLKLCDDPTTTVIAQNGNFDSYFMGYKDHALFSVDFDTLLAHHALYPRLPHNLGFLTAQYTNHAFYKDDKDTFKEGGDIDDFWRYNATDCAITFAVAEKQEKELREQGLYEFFTTHVMRVHKHLAPATVEGIAVDTEVKETLREELGAAVEKHYNAFLTAARHATGSPDLVINPRSPKQLNTLFFDQLGLTAPRRSSDAKNRNNWLKDPRCDHEARDVLLALNQYATEAKFFSTYVESKLDEDGRFRSEYKQFGVSSAPGRLSSGQTLWGSGGNAQNLPRRAYRMFITDGPDTVFIYFDLAQAEARFVGWDANIEQWIADFERARVDKSFDAHRALAATMFNTPYDKVPKKDEIDGVFTQRYIAKRCRHGLNYRMHIARLAETTGLTYGQAAKNYYAYHNTNPELQEWWRVIEKEVKKTRMLFNSYGRRLFITERLDAEGVLDSIVAFRPQSTIGDKVQRVWAQCHEDPEWDHSRARIRMNVHDALWGVATKDFAMKALSIMKRYAEEPIMVKSIVTNETRPMIIPADCKISNIENGEVLSMANMMEVEVE